MDKYAVFLLWLLPVSIALHVFEEFGFPGGLRSWITTYKPRRPKSTLYYVAANAPIFLGACMVALKANDTLGFCIYLFLVDVMGSNALGHIRASIQKKRYCPGTITGSLLALPLMVMSNVYFLKGGLVDLLSAGLLICVGAFIGYYVGGVDIRRKDIT